MAVTDAPQIVTVAHRATTTPTRWRATSPPAATRALRKALTMTPEAVAAEVDAASLLGRGGPGFPAGRKWSMLRKDAGVVPRRQRRRERARDVQGPPTSSSATPTSWSRACSSPPTPCRSPRPSSICAGEFALGLERVQQALQRGLRPRGRSAATSSARTSRSTSWSTPAPAPTSAARRRRSSRRSRASGAFRASSPRSSRRSSASTASPPWSTTSRRCPTCPWIVTNGGAAFAALGAGRSTGTRLFALSGHVRNPGASTSSRWSKTTFRDLIYDPAASAAGSGGGNDLKAFIPGGVSAPWFGPGPARPAPRPGRGGRGGLDARVGLDRRHGRRRTCAVRAAWRITKFFARESCGQCTPCREGSGWLERILYRIEHGGGPRARTSISCWTSATTSRPGSPGRPSRPPSACSGRRSRRRSTRPSRCSATSSWST